MQTMYPGMVNSPVTELAASITNAQTTFDVLNGDALPDAPNLAVIGEGELAETILYTGKTGVTLSGITRGVQGAARAWTVSGESTVSVARNFTERDYAALVANINELDENKAGTALATTSVAGLMPAADRAALNAATPASTANTLVKRDAEGRFKAAAPADEEDVARKAEIDEVNAQLADIAQDIADKVTKDTLVFNVKDYGAIGNGVADDTAPIQAARTAAADAGGGVVFIPAGVYLAGQISIPANIIFRGAGIDNTVLIAKDNLNMSFLLVSTVDDVHIEDMTVDGNGANQTGGSNITFFRARYCSVRRLKVINSHVIALNMSNVENSIIDGCHLNGTIVNTVISFSNDDSNYATGNNKILNCVIENGALDGIIYNNGNGTIIGNTIRGCGAIAGNTASGIYSNARRNLTITENVIYSNDGNGIDLIDCFNSNISNNTVYSNNSAGIMLSGVNRAQVIGNTSYNNGITPVSNQEDGISLLAACTNVVIANNTCYDNQGTKTQPWGIDISADSTNIIVEFNNVTGNINADGIRNLSTNDNIVLFGNLPFNKFSNSAKSFSFSLAASATFVLTHSPAALVVVEIADKTLQTYGRYFLRGSNNGVYELEDPSSAFEPSDSGSLNAIYHNGTNYVIKNRRGTTAFYSYKISYM